MEINMTFLSEIMVGMKQRNQIETIDAIVIACMECADKLTDSEHGNFKTILNFLSSVDVKKLMKSKRGKYSEPLIEKILKCSSGFFNAQKGDAGFYGDEDCDGGPMDAGDFEEMDVYEYVSNVTFEPSGLSPKAFKDAMKLNISTDDSKLAAELIIGYFFDHARYAIADYAKRYNI